MLKKDELAMRNIRGKQISVIFQNPTTSLNPVFTCGEQITRVIMLHQKLAIQAQILKLMNELREEIGTTILYITHDLAVAAQVCDRIAVMYAGNKKPKKNKKPKHPYTLSLMKSIPSKEKKKEKMLPVIKGTVPTLINPPQGCRFHPRCDSCMEICKKEKPKVIEVEDQHWVSCFLYN